MQNLQPESLQTKGVSTPYHLSVSSYSRKPILRGR